MNSVVHSENRTCTESRAQWGFTTVECPARVTSLLWTLNQHLVLRRLLTTELHHFLFLCWSQMIMKLSTESFLILTHHLHVYVAVGSLVLHSSIMPIRNKLMSNRTSFYCVILTFHSKLTSLTFGEMFLKCLFGSTLNGSSSVLTVNIQPLPAGFYLNKNT